MWGFLALSCLVACDFTHGSLPPVDAREVDAHIWLDAPAPLHLTVEAWMDGRSRLIFNGHTVKWHHYEYAAPGREQFVNKPTKLDGVDWYPTWPDIPDAENRDCDCESSTYEDLPITMPRVPTTTTLDAIQARRAPSVIEQPSETNNYTLTVELTDIGASGSSTDIVELVIAFD